MSREFIELLAYCRDRMVRKKLEESKGLLDSCARDITVEQLRALLGTSLTRRRQWSPGAI